VPAAAGVRGALRAVLAALDGDSVGHAELAAPGEPGRLAEVIFHGLARLPGLDEAPGRRHRR
jgi:hypothetical protein